jgi:soluble lytic murein transglycosylase-like protein
MRNALLIIIVLLSPMVSGRNTNPIPQSVGPAKILLQPHEMDEFDRYILAIITVESAGDHRAISTKGAHGLMQVTSIAAKEASVQCALPIVTDMNLLLEPRRNVTYGSCYFRHVLNQHSGDYTRALIVYNGGYAQLAKYEKGIPMVSETANYVLQVRRAFSNQLPNVKDLQ